MKEIMTYIEKKAPNIFHDPKFSQHVYDMFYEMDLREKDLREYDNKAENENSLSLYPSGKSYKKSIETMIGLKDISIKWIDREKRESRYMSFEKDMDEEKTVVIRHTYPTGKYYCHDESIIHYDSECYMKRATSSRVIYSNYAIHLVSDDPSWIYDPDFPDQAKDLGLIPLMDYIVTADKTLAYLADRDLYEYTKEILYNKGCEKLESRPIKTRKQKSFQLIRKRKITK